MSDYDLDYDPFEEEYDEEYERPTDEYGNPIWEGVTSYDPNRSTNAYTTDIGQIFGVFANEKFLNEKVQNRQFRSAASGRFGHNIVSGGRINRAFIEAITRSLRKSILQNYDAFPKKESTGALGRAISSGELINDEGYENLRFQFSLNPNIQRVRTRQWKGWTQTTIARTGYYGPLYILGRQGFTNSTKMIFPASPGGNMIRTTRVGPAPPHDIFKMSDTQIKDLKDAISAPMVELVKEQIAADLSPY